MMIVLPGLDELLMPIEFNCRFCNAMIRVPDNSGGGKGRCPKCTMRITVPKKSALKPVVKSPVEDQPFVLSEMDDETNLSPVPTFASEPVTAINAAPEFFNPTELPNSRIGELPVVSSISASTSSVARRSKKRKRGSSAWIIGAAIVVALLAAVGYLLYPGLVAERLSGELIAGTSEMLELRPAVIDKSRVKLSSDVVAELLKKLEHSPLPLNSNSMQVHLTGTPQGLQISVTAGAQTQFYRVNLQGNDAVQKFLNEHASKLEEERSKDVDDAATAFFTTYQKVLAKTSPPESVTAFRDSLALPSLVGGFGHQVVAAYGRGLYRCVYEDRDGGLYFLLPAGAKEFDVVGRKDPDGRVVVPADFKVKVQGEIAQPKKADDKSQPKPTSKAKATKDEDEQDTDDQSMIRKK